MSSGLGERVELRSPRGLFGGTAAGKGGKRGSGLWGEDDFKTHACFLNK